jgi:putative endonuclease
VLHYKRVKSRHIKLGKRGEKLARRYLTAKNIEILLYNYKNRKGEIDIIARDGAEICFIEVKTRRHTTRSRPAEGLSRKQELRISQSAISYLRSIKNPEVVYRFDLIEVIIGRWDVKELFYWRNCFSPQKKHIPK